MKKSLLLILFLCIGCLSPETKNAIKVLDRASRSVQKHPIGDCKDHTRAIAMRALKQGVKPRYFRYCIMERIEQGKKSGCTINNCIVIGRHKHRVRHMALLFYGWDYPVVVTSTGKLVTGQHKTFVCLEECYEKSGYYLVESWQEFNGKLYVWKHETEEAAPVYSASLYDFSTVQSISYSKNYWKH